MIKAREFRGDRNLNPSPITEFELFLKRKGITEDNIISINYDANNSDYRDNICSILLVYKTNE